MMDDGFFVGYRNYNTGEQVSRRCVAGPESGGEVEE
jgi:hypothetical protein